MKEYSSPEMLAKLISFDTTSWKSNLDLIEFVTGYLKEYGVSSQVFYNEEKTKANLLAVIGPEDIPGIILSGHTDVVPVAQQNWSHDPFDMVEKQGRLFGRGSSDMKGFIACLLAAVPDFTRDDLKEPVHIALSYDEEIGCTGVMSLVEHVRRMPVKPRACIVGEPTEMKVVNGHKGVYHMMTRIYGLEAHSSTDRGVNAVGYAAKMIVFLEGLQAEMRGRPPEIEGFEPPYSTINVGRINGGTASNITPAYCEVEWDYRPMPGSDADEITDRLKDFVEQEILPDMRAKSPEYAKVETQRLSLVPSLLPESGSTAETLVLALAGQNALHKVSYGTEAGIFQATGGVPTVVCGPGSILQAHKADEYIALSELCACDEFLGKLQNMVRA